MASSGVLEDYEWERLPDMATPRCYSVAAYHEGKLYVLGRLVPLATVCGSVHWCVYVRTG